jgi:hydroxymethylpyrimidine pyrophosphatase-like HAD family hydrolase
LVREEDLPEVAALIRSTPDLCLSPATTPWAPGLVFANVTAPGVSKGSALSLVADRLGTTVDRIAMVGDSDNDLDALRVAGIAVVMGSAPDSLKALADFVVADVDEGGLTQALDLLDHYRG